MFQSSNFLEILKIGILSFTPYRDRLGKTFWRLCKRQDVLFVKSTQLTTTGNQIFWAIFCLRKGNVSKWRQLSLCCNFTEKVLEVLCSWNAVLKSKGLSLNLGIGCVNKSKQRLIEKPIVIKYIIFYNIFLRDHS